MTRIILIGFLFTLQACQEQNICDKEYRLEQQLFNAKLRIAELERRSCVELITTPTKIIESNSELATSDATTCVAEFIQPCVDDICFTDPSPQHRSFRTK